MSDNHAPSPTDGVATPAADTLAGLDPAGLLRQGVDPAAAPTATAPAPRWQAPAPAELAALLPQLEVGELIGQGGMGAVYRAVQRHLDRTVALKILPRELGADPDFAARFAREARALARLSHPNLVTIHDYGQTDGWCWLVMEHVDGANLRQVMRTGRLSAQQALAIVPQLCDALQYAHDEGVVHRDIKPENILMDARGRVKIADFGLAKLRGEAPKGEALTASGTVLGTVHYMAPEQVEGAKDVDHRADIYSLGVVFYEMLTGGLPLGRFDPPSRRIQLDVRFDEVVLKALEKDPARRYQQASEVQSAVEGAQAAAPAPAPAATPAKSESGIRIGGLHIDDQGVRFGDQLVIDDRGIRIGGKVVVAGRQEPEQRNRFTNHAMTLLAGGMLVGLLSVRQLAGEPLAAAPWWLLGSVLAAPLMFLGGVCLQLRTWPTVAGLGCYAAILPVMASWQEAWQPKDMSMWLATCVTLVVLWLVSAVGGGSWDRHFAGPVRRLHVVLLVLLAMAMVALGVGGLAFQRSHEFAPAPLLPFDASGFDNGDNGNGTATLVGEGPGTHPFTGITGLPRTRRFVARPMMHWDGVAGSVILRMWVGSADGNRRLVERELALGAVGIGNTPVASNGWQEIPLPCDASASTSAIQDVSFELAMPGAGRVEVMQPILVEDQQDGVVESPARR